ncbi:hypothetical protein N8I77_012658 [Diaporthe amygdali]|uniref:Protein kinase domain-containing protein n=1 Tax=Phomopsis amygdali TaxID=1214568 RepID=A0AAD9S308_PHOAM|nr:hypothetical protein N8I77_012658 [Diaporthe amygdali]
MSAELALAIVATVDLCLKYGTELKQVCTTLGAASSEVAEAVLQLENGLLRFQQQLDFSQRIRHLMSRQHQEIYDRSLVMFQSKLEILKSILQSATSRTDLDGLDRLKYLWNRNVITEAIKNLEIWQALTDQTWFLFMTIVDAGVDDALTMKDSKVLSIIPSASTIRSSCMLNKSLSGAKLVLPHGEIEKMEVSDIAFSDVKLAKRDSSSGSSSIYILNEISGLQSPPGSYFSRYTIAKEDSGKLASRLQHNEPGKFGLLTCKGFTLSGTKANPKITLVLRTPPGLLPCPRSLRDLLLSTELPGSLTQRLDIAKGLANAVGYVHVFGFVHKNIRPESILCFNRPDGEIASTFLVGFEFFRRDMGWTQRLGDTAPDKNLYRHPSRQGIDPTYNYTMQHDIYSLGVCLLEIGLWKSFIDYSLPSKRIGALVSDALQSPSGVNDQQLNLRLSVEGKERLVCLAREKLPQFMGTKYSEVTIACLTFMDKESLEPSDDLEPGDDNDVLVGVQYIDQILLLLNMIVM